MRSSRRQAKAAAGASEREREREREREGVEKESQQRTCRRTHLLPVFVFLILFFVLLFVLRGDRVCRDKGLFESYHRLNETRPRRPRPSPDPCLCPFSLYPSLCPEGQSSGSSSHVLKDRGEVKFCVHSLLDSVQKLTAVLLFVLSFSIFFLSSRRNREPQAVTTRCLEHFSLPMDLE